MKTETPTQTPASNFPQGFPSKNQIVLWCLQILLFPPHPLILLVSRLRPINMLARNILLRHQPIPETETLGIVHGQRPRAIRMMRPVHRVQKMTLCSPRITQNHNLYGYMSHPRLLPLHRILFIHPINKNSSSNGLKYPFLTCPINIRRCICRPINIRRCICRPIKSRRCICRPINIRRCICHPINIRRWFQRNIPRP